MKSFAETLSELENSIAQGRRNDKERDSRTRVYFIQESGMGAVKIGVSRHAHERVKELRGSTPHTLRLLATVEGGCCVEATLHLLFRHAHVSGEWFRPVAELIGYIEKEGELPEATKKRELEALFDKRRKMRVIA